MNDIVKIITENNINGFHNDGGTDKILGHSYDIFYSECFNNLINKKGVLLEIGVQYGGSSLLWHELLKNFNLVLTDINNQIHEKIIQKMDKNRYEFFLMDSFRKESVELLKLKYPNGFDIIIDDGPHTFESQQFTLKEYSKLLNENGILIIEDIQRYEYCEQLISTPLDINFSSLDIVDLRHVKNRYDDLLIVLKK
jgi:SAM-dependent methyltransferase